MTYSPSHEFTTNPSANLADTGHDGIVDDPRRRMLILAAMCSALVAVVASVSGLNVALQVLAADLEATQNQLLWIVNGYTLTLAALLMPIGAIGDRWGRKIVLVAGLTVFMAANALSAFVNNPEILIALRIVAGAGAAMIMPVTLSVITTSFPQSERARAIGIWAGFAGTGGIIGLFASAAIIDNTSWPWIFTVPLALAGLAFALTIMFVPRSHETTLGRFDILGSVTSALAIGGLVLGIQEGPERGWTNALTLSGLVIGIAALILFVLIELRQENPLLDVRVFKVRALATGSVNLFVVFALMFTLFLVLIQFLQAALGYSALRSAAALLPMAAVMMPLSTTAPTIADRIGYNKILIFGMSLLSAGMVLIALLADLNGGYLSVLPGIIVLGSGVGLSMSPSTTAITSALPPEKQGVASALNDTVRELGGAVGIALIGSILNAQYRNSVSDATTGLPPEIAERVEQGIGGALATAAQLGPEGQALLNNARLAFLDGLQTSLLVGAAIAAGAAVFTAFQARPEQSPR
ncbi:MAG: MFS transporter [Acidimicrobiales bacterium]